VTDHWRYVCPECGSVSLYARQDDTYRYKQCSEIFAHRYDNKHDTLV
jgi:hypothetical protein